MTIELTSSAFESGDNLPMRYTCDGAGVSPPLQWRYAPDETKSLVLICDDPDAPRGAYSHWVLYDIPPRIQQLPEGVSPGGRLSWGGVQGRNDAGHVQYTAPCPPSGPAHHYYFRLYALDEQPELPPGATRQQVLDRIRDHIMDQAELISLYARR
jgi:Raf kinase inhibitor-like YbhB/YbcL family protein